MPRKEWKNVKVPAPLKETISSLSSKDGAPKYKEIEFGIRLLQRARAVYRELVQGDEDGRIQALAWHIAKAIYGIGRAVEAIEQGRDVDARLTKTLRSIQQLKERWGADTEALEVVLNQYARDKRREDKELLVQLAAQLIKEMGMAVAALKAGGQG